MPRSSSCLFCSSSSAPTLQASRTAKVAVKELGRGSDMSENGCTRADFLKMGLASAASLAVAGMAGCAPKSAGESEPAGAVVSGAQDVAWGKEADFVVVGLGAGGLGASLQAIDEGASVIVVEKATAGGKSRPNSWAAAAAWTRRPASV